MSLSINIYNIADRHLKAVTLSLFKPDVSAIFLDMGCGNCEFTNQIVKSINPAYTIVVDSIPVRLRYAQDNGYIPVEADLNKPLPLMPETVDIIHAGNVIEHLNDTDMLIKEIKRMLKPGGYAIISTNNLASWHNIISLVGGRQPSVTMVSDEYPVMAEDDEGMPRHRRIFTVGSLLELCKYHGLKPISYRAAGYYPFPGFMQGIMTSINPGNSAYVIVKVRKDAT